MGSNNPHASLPCWCNQLYAIPTLKKTLNWLTEALETIKIKPKKDSWTLFYQVIPPKTSQKWLTVTIWLSWTVMDDFHWWPSWMTFMDDFHGWFLWMTFMDDFHVLVMDDWTLLFISYFYILITDGPTDELTDWQTDIHWYKLSRYRDWKRSL